MGTTVTIDGIDFRKAQITIWLTDDFEIESEYFPDKQEAYATCSIRIDPEELPPEVYTAGLGMTQIIMTKGATEEEAVRNMIHKLRVEGRVPFFRLV